MSSSSDSLWLTVASFFSNNSRSQQDQLIWRQADPNKSECHHCVAKGGGVVVKCSVDRCKREYHIECGFKNCGFFLDDNNFLTFLCEVHHKPILFCTCNKPYDPTAEMICCDECIEWFHIKCVGVSSKAVSSIDTYICQKCSQLRSEGKSTPVLEKERNISKEQKSSNQQEANKSLRLLTEVSETICPLIDQINHAFNHHYTIAQMKGAFQYLSSDLFKAVHLKHKVSLDDSSDNLTVPESEQTADAIRLFGTEDLLHHWKFQLEQGLSDHSQWISLMKSFPKKFKQEMLPSLNQNHFKNIQEFMESLNQLLELTRRLPVPDETEECLPFLQAYADLWALFIEFFQALHNDTSAPSWSKQLEATLNPLNNKTRRLQQLATQDSSRFQPFLPFLTSHIQLGNSTVDKIMQWIQDADSILAGNTEYSATVEDVEEMIDEAADFPIELTQVLELKTAIGDSRQVNFVIEYALKSENIEFNEYARLADMVGEQRVKIPLFETWQMVGERVNLLQNYSTVIVEERIPIETIEQLQDLSSDILTEETTEDDAAISSYDLIKSLNGKVSNAKQSLLSLLNEVEGHVSKASDVIQALAASTSTIPDLSTAIEQLKSLRVVTDEENILTFTQTYVGLYRRYETVKSAAELEPLSSVSALRAELTTLLESATVNDSYERYVSIRREAANLLEILTQTEELATRLWRELQHYISVLKEGKEWGAVTFDDFVSIHDRAYATGLSLDVAILKEFQTIRNEAEVFIDECHNRLTFLVSIKDDFMDIKSLEQRGRFLPLPKKLFDDIHTRFTVASLANQCLDMISTLAIRANPLTDSMDVDTPNDSSKLNDILPLRLLHQSLQEQFQELTHKHGTSSPGHAHAIEESMLQQIYHPFELLYWRAEVHHMLAHRASKRDAELLRQLGTEVQAAEQAPFEWELLLNAWEKSQQFEDDAKTLFAGIQESIAISNQAVNQSSVGPPVTIRGTGNTATSFDLKSFVDGAKAFKQHIGESQQYLKSLLTKGHALKIMEYDIEMKLEDYLNLIVNVQEVSVTITDVQISMSPKQSSAMSQKDKFSVPTNQPIADFKVLTTLVNDFDQVTAKHNDFELLRIMSDFLYNLHSQAALWNENAATVISIKAARRKLKPDGKPFSVEDLHDLCSSPVCSAIKLPMLETISNILTEIAQIESETLLLFMSGKSSPIGQPSVEIQKEISNKDQMDIDATIETNDDPLSLLIKKCRDLLTKVDNLAFEIPEGKILSWLVDVLMWVQTVPPSYQKVDDDESKVVGKLFSVADLKILIQRASEIFDPIPDSIENWLFRHGILFDDESGEGVCFHDEVNIYLYRSQLIVEKLKDLNEDTSNILASIKTAVTSNENLESIKSIMSRVQNSNVIFEGDVKKALELLVNKISVYETSKRSKQPDSKSLASIQKPSGTKKLKTGTANCLNCNCAESAEIESYYCGSKCAITHSTSLLHELLSYRKILCVQNPRYSPSVENRQDLIDCIDLNRNAFRHTIGPSDLSSLFASSSKEMKRRGLVTTSLHQELLSSGSSLESRSKIDDEADILEIMLMEAERCQHRLTMEAGGSGDSLPGKTNESSDKYSTFKSLLTTLPTISASVVSKPVTMVKSPRSSTPISPANQKGSVTTQTVHNISDQEFRKNTRFGFEDIFINALSRQGVNGALCCGATLAIEVEQELYTKHDPIKEGSKSEFNKNEYKAQQLMLFRNLKQSHNDILVVQMARMELSIANLLAMSPQQFADSATQLQRAKDINSALKESELKLSVSDEMEARSRATMTGSEGWRTKEVSDSNAISLNQAISEIKSEESTSTSSSSFDSKKYENMFKQKRASKTELSSSSTDTSNSKDSKSHKRTIDVDAGTRYTTDRPKKLRDSFEKLEDVTNLSSKSSIDDSPSPSPRESLKPKGPGVNVAEMLRASANAAKEEKKALKYYKLLSASGSKQFVVKAAPNALAFDCIGCVSDRRLNGILKEVILIEGRVPIDKVNSYVNDSITANRHITFIAFFVAKNLPATSGYAQLCDEYISKGRAGLFKNGTESDRLNFYILPPTLKNQITAFKKFVIPENTDRLLLGIVVTKDLPTSEISNTEVEEVSLDNPPEPEIMSRQSGLENKSNHNTGAHAARAPTLLPVNATGASVNLVRSAKHTENKAPAVVPSPPVFQLSAATSKPPGVISLATVQNVGAVPPPIYSIVSNPGMAQLQPQSKPGFDNVTTQLPASQTQSQYQAGSGVPFTLPVTGNQSRPVAQAPLQQSPQLPTIGALATSPHPTSVAPPGTLISPDLRRNIEQTAMFCAKNGPQVIQQMRSRPDSMKILFFLFPGQPGHVEFLEALKNAAALIQSQASISK